MVDVFLVARDVFQFSFRYKLCRRNFMYYYGRKLFRII